MYAFPNLVPVPRSTMGTMLIRSARIAMPRDHIWLKCACAFSLNEVGSHLVFVERSSVTIGAAKMAYRMPACVIDNGTG